MFDDVCESPVNEGLALEIKLFKICPRATGTIYYFIHALFLRKFAKFCGNALKRFAYFYALIAIQGNPSPDTPAAKLMEVRKAMLDFLGYAKMYAEADPVSKSPSSGGFREGLYSNNLYNTSSSSRATG